MAPASSKTRYRHHEHFSAHADSLRADLLAHSRILTAQMGVRIRKIMFQKLRAAIYSSWNKTQCNRVDTVP